MVSFAFGVSPILPVPGYRAACSINKLLVLRAGYFVSVYIKLFHICFMLRTLRREPFYIGPKLAATQIRLRRRRPVCRRCIQRLPAITACTMRRSSPSRPPCSTAR